MHTHLCVHTFKIFYLTKRGIAKLPSVTAFFNCLGRAISTLHTTGKIRNSLVLQGACSLKGSAPTGANETMLRGNTGNLQQARVSSPSYSSLNGRSVQAELKDWSSQTPWKSLPPVISVGVSWIGVGSAKHQNTCLPSHLFKRSS